MEKCKMIKELPSIYSKWNKHLLVGEIYNCESCNDKAVHVYGKTLNGGEFNCWILDNVFYNCFVNPIHEKYKSVWQRNLTFFLFLK